MSNSNIENRCSLRTLLKFKFKVVTQSALYSKKGVMLSYYHKLKKHKSLFSSLISRNIIGIP